MTDKRVESIWVPCLDEGSTPSISTKKAGFMPAFFVEWRENLVLDPPLNPLLGGDFTV